jgi:hypothetical protein
MKFGTAIASRIPMIKTTIMISTRVKPLLRRFFNLFMLVSSPRIFMSNGLYPRLSQFFHFTSTVNPGKPAVIHSVWITRRRSERWATDVLSVCEQAAVSFRAARTVIAKKTEIKLQRMSVFLKERLNVAEVGYQGFSVETFHREVAPPSKTADNGCIRPKNRENRTWTMLF